MMGKEMTKNLFNYATKELSQDAFLRWLLENWGCDQKDVRIASQEFLRNLIGLSVEEFGEIKYLKAEAQVKSIDVFVSCKVDETSYVIAIEDKTYSSTHDDQLEKYTNYINENFPEHKRLFVYYKTNILSESERNEIISKNWEIFDIVRIHNIFCKSKLDISNSILSDYVNHISSLYDRLTGSLVDDVSSWKQDHWINFCVNYTPKLPGEIEFNFGSYRKQYIYLQFNVKGKIKSLPYLEIQSREFSNKNNEFSFRFLLHGVDSKIVEANLEKWKEHINKSSLFKSQNHKKQIGINVQSEKIVSVENLQQVIEKYVQEYNKLMI